jgi:hypothetical protein
MENAWTSGVDRKGLTPSISTKPTGGARVYCPRENTVSLQNLRKWLFVHVIGRFPSRVSRHAIGAFKLWTSNVLQGLAGIKRCIHTPSPQKGPYLQAIWYTHWV